MNRPEDFREICLIVSDDFSLQSLLYDINLLPEQTLDDAKNWRLTAMIARHWVAAFPTPAPATPGGYLTDEWIDRVCAPGRAKRWHDDGRQYDRDTARLIIAAALQHQRGFTPAALATSDPEGHRQAIADHLAQPLAASIRERDLLHLSQASDYLEDFGMRERSAGNDSMAEGCKSTAWVLGQIAKRIANPPGQPLDSQRDAPAGEPRPAAWIRTHVTPDTPMGPAEYDVECVPGDEQPQGNGWAPLYASPPLSAQPAEPKLLGWRTDDYLMETADKERAVSWGQHFTILPIFEGDAHTKLATPQPQPPHQEQS